MSVAQDVVARKQRPDDATIAWTVLGASVLGYEVFARPGQLLSEGVDRWLVRNPVAVYLGVGVTAAHLLNLIPDKIDPFVWLSVVAGWVRGRL